MGIFNDNKIRAVLIFEMLGRPKEHLETTMENFLKQLDSEKGIQVINKTLHPAKIFEDKKQENKQEGIVKQELFTTFSEVEIGAEKIIDVAMLVFKYLPSHLEIISPENFQVNNLQFNALLTEMIAKLHNYDSIAKTALMHNQMLAKKFLELKEGKQQMNISQEGKTSDKVEDKIEMNPSEKKDDVKEKPANKSKKKKIESK